MKLVAFSKKYSNEFSIKGITKLTPELKAKILDKLNKEKDADEPKYTRLVCLDGKHICKYCGNIVSGDYEDLLCKDCREIFGHALYSEL